MRALGGSYCLLLLLPCKDYDKANRRLLFMQRASVA